MRSEWGQQAGWPWHFQNIDICADQKEQSWGQGGGQEAVP